ncbi:MAG: amidohydrolase family protein, partial [Candidatus Bathyarchaeia archaeon]
YEDRKCKRFLRMVKDLGLPVLLEEEFNETKRFVDENSDLSIIIPHMGKLNGGHEKMSVFFDKDNVYFDTSTAPIDVIKSFLDAVGPERIIFGSDVSGTREPFYNFPRVELEKLLEIGLEKKDLELVLSGNIERVIRHG